MTFSYQHDQGKYANIAYKVTTKQHVAMSGNESHVLQFAYQMSLYAYRESMIT